MKKNTAYSFWFVLIFVAGGVFSLWGSFFQARLSSIEAPKKVAVRAEQKFPLLTTPKDLQTIKNTQPVVSQNTQNINATKPVTTRTTKTS